MGIITLFPGYFKLGKANGEGHSNETKLMGKCKTVEYGHVDRFIKYARIDTQSDGVYQTPNAKAV